MAALPFQQEGLSIRQLCRHIPKKHPVQTMAVAYWSFHYAKRIFETFVVHRCAIVTLCPQYVQRLSSVDATSQQHMLVQQSNNDEYCCQQRDC